MGTISRPVIGIISYFPDKEPDRSQRITRFERLLKKLTEFLPDVPVLVIAQNWNTYYPKQYKIIRHYYEKLGILKARHVLREKFLESNYNYLIMFDDDALIQYLVDNPGKAYLDSLEANPDKFMFLQYASSQLNGCAISKYIYKLEPMVDIDAEKNEGFEDAIFSWLLHNKYPEKEFTCTAIKCTHFKNPNEYIPSTWAREGQKDWKRLRDQTAIIKEYITINKKFPKLK